MNNLTIGIPVFKGKNYIKKLLGDLELEFNNNFNVIIHENHSDEVIEIDNENYSFPISYTLHNDNYGIDYNILSLINKCETKYIWLIGCDDRLVPGSISLMLSFLNINEKNSEIAFTIANWEGYDLIGNKEYSCAIDYSENIITKDTVRFFKNFGTTLGPQFYMSSYVLNTNLISKEKYNYSYNYRGFIHWAILLDLAKKGENCFYSKPLIRHISGTETYIDKWIKIFFIEIPLFLNEHVPNKVLREVFLGNKSYNLNSAKNIIHKKAISNYVFDLNFLFKIIKNNNYFNFYFYAFIPLILPNFICKLLIRKN